MMMMMCVCAVSGGVVGGVGMGVGWRREGAALTPTCSRAMLSCAAAATATYSICDGVLGVCGPMGAAAAATGISSISGWVCGF